MKVKGIYRGSREKGNGVCLYRQSFLNSLTLTVLGSRLQWKLNFGAEFIFSNLIQFWLTCLLFPENAEEIRHGWQNPEPLLTLFSLLQPAVLIRSALSMLSGMQWCSDFAISFPSHLGNNLWWTGSALLYPSTTVRSSTHHHALKAPSHLLLWMTVITNCTWNVPWICKWYHLCIQSQDLFFYVDSKETLISLCKHSRLRYAPLWPRYVGQPTGYPKWHFPEPTRISVLNRAALTPFLRSCG